MSSGSSSEILRDALANLPRSAQDATSPAFDALREKVCAVVDDLKAKGMQAEHVVLAIKRIAASAQMGPSGWQLSDAIVKWCLERYFKESADSSGV